MTDNTKENSVLTSDIIHNLRNLATQSPETPSELILTAARRLEQQKAQIESLERQKLDLMVMRALR